MSDTKLVRMKVETIRRFQIYQLKHAFSSFIDTLNHISLVIAGEVPSGAVDVLEDEGVIDIGDVQSIFTGDAEPDVTHVNFDDLDF